MGGGVSIYIYLCLYTYIPTYLYTLYLYVYISLSLTYLYLYLYLCLSLYLFLAVSLSRVRETDIALQGWVLGMATSRSVGLRVFLATFHLRVLGHVPGSHGEDSAVRILVASRLEVGNAPRRPHLAAMESTTFRSLGWEPVLHPHGRVLRSEFGTGPQTCWLVVEKN